MKSPTTLGPPEQGTIPPSQMRSTAGEGGNPNYEGKLIDSGIKGLQTFYGYIWGVVSANGGIAATIARILAALQT